MAEIALFSRRLAEWSGAPHRDVNWYTRRSSFGGVNMMPLATAELLVVETTRSAPCPKQLSTKRSRRKRNAQFGMPHDIIGACDALKYPIRDTVCDNLKTREFQGALIL